MNLARLQRDLAALIRGEAVAGGDAYTAAVAGSCGLEVTRGIIASWRELLLRRTCLLTVALLEQRGRFATALAELGGRHLSAYGEAAACAFLEQFASDADVLVAAVARFELAAIEARYGDGDERTTIIWPLPPDEVIARLMLGQPVDAGLPAGDYEMIVSAEPAA
jgi:hypothetical protein